MPVPGGVSASKFRVFVWIPWESGYSDNDVMPELVDQSGNGNDIPIGTGGALYKTNVVNGLPAVLFDGVNDNYERAWTSGSERITYFLVMRHLTVPGTDRCIVSGLNGGGEKVMLGMVNGGGGIGGPCYVVEQSGTGGGAHEHFGEGVPQTSTFVVHRQRYDTTDRGWSDGVEMTDGELPSSTAGNNPTQGITLGSREDRTRYWHGELVGFACCVGLTDQEEEDIEADLMSMLASAVELESDVTISFSQVARLTNSYRVSSVIRFGVTASLAFGAGAVNLAATPQIRFFPVGDLTQVNKLTASSTIVFTPTSSLKVTKQLAATSSIVFSPTATLDTVATLSATSSILFSPQATLKTTKQLSAGATILFAPPAELDAMASLRATSSILFTPTSSLHQTHELRTAATIQFNASASAVGLTELTATSLIRFTPTAALTTLAELDGNSSIVFAPTGELDTIAELRASSLISFTPVAEVTAVADVRSSSAILFGVSGQLSVIASLRGTSAIAFDVDGNLTTISRLVSSSSIIFGVVGVLQSFQIGDFNAAPTIRFTPVAVLTVFTASRRGTLVLTDSAVGGLLLTTSEVGSAGISDAPAGSLELSDA